MITHTGSCHCGHVSFEVIAPAKLQVSECNCSMCSKVGFLHLIGPADRFKLLSGIGVLFTFLVNAGTANYMCCSVGGSNVYYVSGSHHDRITVSARGIEPGTADDTIV